MLSWLGRIRVRVAIIVAFFVMAFALLVLAGAQEFGFAWPNTPSSYASVLAIPVALVLAARLAAGLSRDLAALRANIDRMAAGDYSEAVALAAREDEIGELARAVDGLRQQTASRLQAAFSEEKAEAIRRTQAEAARAAAEDVRRSVRAAVLKLDDMALALSKSSHTVSESAVSTRGAVTEGMTALEHAMTTVRAATAGVEELSQAAGEIARQAERATGVSRSARDLVASAVDQTRALESRVSEISNFVKLVEEIAAQTNLLALNATIEAARAGAAGRGFAVVAQEVKELAAQTGKATAEITAKTAAIHAASGKVGLSIHGVLEAIDGVDFAATSIASAISQHDETTNAISRNVADATENSAVVIEEIGRVAQSAERTGAVAQELEDFAQKLGSETKQLRLETDRLLDRFAA